MLWKATRKSGPDATAQRGQRARMSVGGWSARASEIGVRATSLTAPALGVTGAVGAVGKILGSRCAAPGPLGVAWPLEVP